MELATLGGGLVAWILIIGLYLTGDRGGVAVTSVRFTTKEACEAAGKAMSDEWRRGALSLRDQSRWICAKE